MTQVNVAAIEEVGATEEVEMSRDFILSVDITMTINDFPLIVEHMCEDEFTVLTKKSIQTEADISYINILFADGEAMEKPFGLSEIYCDKKGDIILSGCLCFEFKNKEIPLEQAYNEVVAGYKDATIEPIAIYVNEADEINHVTISNVEFKLDTHLKDYCQCNN